MTHITSRLSALKYPLLLLLAAAIWGLGTCVVKDTVSDFPPFWLVGIRFFSAGVIFTILFAPRFIRLAQRGRLFEHIKVGALLGVIVGSAYLLNTTGLTATTAAKSSFLTGLYCVIVPFLAWMIMRKRPTVFNITAALLCVAGVGLVSLGNGTSLSLGLGEFLTLGSAVMLGLQCVVTSKAAPGRDMMVLTALEFLVGGGIALVLGMAFEPAPTAAMLFEPAVITNIAYLVLFATCAALLLQNVGLAKVAPSPGALLLSFESVFGVIFSVLVLNEVLTMPMLAGFALIFMAVLVSEWLPTSPLAKRIRKPRAKAAPIQLTGSIQPVHAKQVVREISEKAA